MGEELLLWMWDEKRVLDLGSGVEGCIVWEEWSVL